MVIKKLLFLLFLLFYYFNSIAQNSFYDDIHLMDYQRTRQLLYDSNEAINNSFLIRSNSSFQFLQSKLKGTTKDIIQFVNFNFDQQNNSLLPISFNDGNMYPARGWQERYSVGVNLKLLFFDINYQPEKLTVQNLTQEYYPGNTGDGNFMFKYFGMVANNIDNFRQFGYDRIEETTLGQSRVGIKFKYIAAGLSNENIWWGPGKRNALLFTNNAPGFLHAFLQTKKPIKTKIGNFEFNAIYGELGNVDYTHPDDSIMRTIWSGAIQEKFMNTRNIQAFTINWNPKWMNNFYIGYSFSQQSYKEDSLFFTKKIPSEKNKMTLGAVMFRYVMPRDHAEFYAEIGQPDRTATPGSFFNDTVKTGFVFGVTKLTKFKSNKSYLRLNVEMAQLQLYNPKDMFYPGWAFVGGLPNSWYTSDIIKQGYTNQGQILGAPIGPGSNSQSIAFSWNKGFNKIGLFFERLVHNSDFYHYAYLTGLLGYSRADAYWVDLNGGVEVQFMPYKNILIAGTYQNTNAMNYRWVKNVNDISVDKFADPGIDSDKYNSQFNFSVKFLFNGPR